MEPLPDPLELSEESLRSTSDVAKEALAGMHGDGLKKYFDKQRAAIDNGEWAKGYANLFPNVKPWGQMAPMALWVIAAYAKDVGIMPLKRNHARCFTQPMGFVGDGTDVDLVTGVVVKHPGHHGKNIGNGTCKPEHLVELKRLLNSETFRKLPEENSASGNDGCSVLIEVDVDGNYSWKCYWGSRNKVFHEVAGALLDLLVFDSSAS
jgi:hypothetical protein